MFARYATAQTAAAPISDATPMQASNAIMALSNSA
jgi:hypothetical protein